MSGLPWSDWVGRTETAFDTVSPTPARALRATLGGEPAGEFTPGARLPQLWTWLYFLPLAPMGEVGPDGHPKRGGFLPPIDLPRRMWAGSRCAFHEPVRIGDEIQKTSTIVKVSEKVGNAGALVFITVRHEVSAMGRLAVIEEQDLVYMNIPTEWKAPAATPLPPCAWSEPVDIDPVFLFRFSALTFNGHRIHYDRTYATEIEKYPGLVVHGPAQAVLLIDAATRRYADRTPSTFTFRGIRPLFDFDKTTCNGAPRTDGGMDLFTANADGAIAMQACLTWAA